MINNNKIKLLFVVIFIINISNGYGYVDKDNEDEQKNDTSKLFYKELMAQREFIADSVWGNEKDKKIPLFIGIRDSNGTGYEYSFYLINIIDKNNNNTIIKTIGLNELGLPISGTCDGVNYATININYWYNLIFIEPEIFTLNDNGTINFVVSFNGSYCGFDTDEVQDNIKVISIDPTYLKPKKYQDWYCGDTHYHSSYTDTKFLLSADGEFGGPINTTFYMANSIGLDWISITDHSNSFSRHKNDNLNWENFKMECEKYPSCLIGTEINCDYSLSWWDLGGRGNHLLSYDYSTYIEDDFWGIFGYGNPYCKDVINNIYSQDGFVFPAHPESLIDVAGVIASTWHNYSLPFTGLQVWNGDLKTEHVRNDLDQGLIKWQDLLLGRENLTPRKVFISAGTDAHGDFNTLFGKAMTCVYSPVNSSSTDYKSNIFDALKTGKSYLSNNGALKFSITTPYESDAMLGQTTSIFRGDSLTINIDYNVINPCDLALYRGVMGELNEQLLENFSIISNQGTKQFTDTPTNNSYYRVQCINNTDRIYTNPIWVDIQELQLISPNNSSWTTYNKDYNNSGTQTGIGFFGIRNFSLITNLAEGMNYQPLIDDINRDSLNEIIIFSGNYLKIFDQEFRLIDEIIVGELQSQPALFDIDNDGFIEIIFISKRTLDHLLAYEYSGEFIQELDIEIPNGGFGSGIRCLNLDAKPTCIFKDNSNYLHIFDTESKNDEVIRLSNSTTLREIIPTIADIDADGNQEAVFWFDNDGNGNYGLGVFDLTQKKFDSYFNSKGIIDDIVPGGIISLKGSPITTDVNNDGKLEIAVTVFYDDSCNYWWCNDWFTQIWIFAPNGTTLISKCKPDHNGCNDGNSIRREWEGSNPFVLDYNNDGKNDFCYIRDTKINNEMGMACYNSTSELVEVKMYPMTKVITADMNNDGRKELISESRIVLLNGTSLYSYNSEVQPPVPVDINKNNGLDLIWTQRGKSSILMDEEGIIKINNISIDPVSPSMHDDVSCSFIPFGPGKIFANISWYRNSIIEKSETIACKSGNICTSSKLSTGLFSKGDILACSVSITNGKQYSSTKSKTTKILDSSEWNQYNDEIGTGQGKGYFRNRNISKIQANQGTDLQPRVADIDRDNENEIILYSNFSLIILNPKLELESKEKVGEMTGQFDVADLDGDNFAEIIGVVKNNQKANFTIWEYEDNAVRVKKSFEVNQQGAQYIRCLKFDSDDMVDCIYKDFNGIIHSYNIGSNDQNDDYSKINISSGSSSSKIIEPIVSDFDRDNDKDICFIHNTIISCIDENNEISFNTSIGSSPTGLRIAQLDQGFFEIIAVDNHIGAGVWNTFRYISKLYVFNSDSSIKFQKTYSNVYNDYDYSIGDPLILDINKDGFDDVCNVIGYSASDEPGTGRIICYRYDGTQIHNQVIFNSNNFSIYKNKLADIDNDNVLEIINSKAAIEFNYNNIININNNDLGESIAVDIDKNKGLDILYSRDGKTILYLDNQSEPIHQTLLELYAPVLFFHPNEKFFPTIIEAALNEGDLYSDGTIIDEMPVSIDSLGLPEIDNGAYLDMRESSGGFEEWGTYQIPGPSRFNNYPDTIYGRKVEIDGIHTVLQYWMFYPYNDWRNKHEGDWELVQIILNKKDANFEPSQVTYSIHGIGNTVEWGELQKLNNTHPALLVSLGEHAFYLSEGEQFWLKGIGKGCDAYMDTVSNDGKVMYPYNYSITEIEENSSWVKFPGSWGEIGPIGTSGQKSPVYLKSGLFTPWEDPLEWANSPVPSLYLACTGSPVNLHALDQNGTHTGLNNDMNIENGIPSAFYIPSNNGKELINIFTSSPLTFFISSTGTGAFNLSIFSIRNNSNFIDLHYQDVNITNTTSAKVNMTVKNPNFIMLIDEEGDGIIDTTKEPDALILTGENNNTEIDSDNDGIADSIDNCRYLYNPSQIKDKDTDGFIDILCDGEDCNDNDYSINPNAIEECNNKDDNCNELIDENLARECGVSSLGICSYGEEKCEDGSWQNCTAVLPILESCNGLDDDCDGSTDEDFGIGKSCSAGVGECSAEGRIECDQDGNTSFCSAVPKSAHTEICDEKDNDCNGKIDDICSRNTKKYAVNLLEQAKESKDCNKHCRNQLIDIIELVNKSLELKYYIDNEILNPHEGQNNGHFVFSHESQAISHCLIWGTSKKIDEICNTISSLLLAADEEFAIKALDIAKTTALINIDNQKCFEREIIKANSSIEKSDDIFAVRFPIIAIHLYNKSWQHSQKAIEIAKSVKDICNMK